MPDHRIGLRNHSSQSFGFVFTASFAHVQYVETEHFSVANKQQEEAIFTLKQDY